MRTIAFRLAVSACVSSLFLGCPPVVTECIDGTEAVCEDAGALPPDFCNSKEEAETDTTNCQLNITTGGAAKDPKGGVYISRLSDGGTDQDWYLAQTPANLTARSLLHFGGGYSAPQSGVNFSINVLKEGPDGGLVSVATAIDKHGPAAPRPVDVILPFADSNTRLYVIIADEGVSGQVRVDNRNPYSVFMEIVENPDVNEPNDATPTPIALTGSPIQEGSQTGFIATNDDVDTFSFPVMGAGRQVIYMHITAPQPTKAPPYRLSYTLFDPSGVPIAEGVMANEFLRIDLATARLAPMTGTYKVEVKGYRPPNTTGAIPGDLSLQYTVALKVIRCELMFFRMNLMVLQLEVRAVQTLNLNTVHALMDQLRRVYPAPGAA